LLKKLGCDEETEKDEVVLLNSSYRIVSYVVVNFRDTKSGLVNIIVMVNINTVKYCEILWELLYLDKDDIFLDIFYFFWSSSRYLFLTDKLLKYVFFFL